MIQLVPNQLIRGFVSQQSDPTLRGWVSRSDEIDGRTFFPRKSNEHCWTSLLPPTPWHLRPNKVLGSETAVWLFLGHCCLFLVIWVVIQYIGHWHPPTPVEYFIKLFSSWISWSSSSWSPGGRRRRLAALGQHESAWLGNVTRSCNARKGPGTPMGMKGLLVASFQEPFSW